MRGRVRESARGRGGRGRSALDLDDIGKQAGRLTDLAGGSRGMGTAASGLAGAASGLAGGGLAQRFLGGGAEGSEEEFRREVLERLDLMEERLARLEDEVLGPVEEEGAQEETGALEEGASDPNSTQ